jgi:hypothetical protein
MTTTPRAIRDACVAAVQLLTPRSLAADRFDLYRDDHVPFETWIASNPQIIRRFTMRDMGARLPPTVSHTDTVRERVIFEVLVVYPHSYRYGTKAARDMQDVIDEDQRQIDHAIGLHGGATIGVDATFLVAASRWDRVELDTSTILVGTLAYEFWRTSP